MTTDKLILALDIDNPAEALALVDKTRDSIACFKVGKQLFTREGPSFVRELRRRGVDVFLDLKFHDIPQTVAKAVKAAAELDVKFLTIHTSGGSEMMQAARDAAGNRLQILGVTVLTSMDDDALKEVGFDHTAAGQVVHLAKLAAKSGLTGLVCSPLEIELIRQQVSPTITLVTPGIRPSGGDTQDQKRTLSAREAIQRGASYLVVGRPITQAPDPAAAARALAQECVGE